MEKDLAPLRISDFQCTEKGSDVSFMTLFNDLIYEILFVTDCMRSKYIYESKRLINCY